MAITVHAVQEYQSSAPATSHTIGLGTLGLVSGDRCIVFCTTGKNNLSPGISWAALWNELSDTTSTEGAGVTHSPAYRDMGGSPPSSVQIDSVNAVDCSAIAVRISGHDPASPPEVATAINTPVDPPSLSPSWGSSTFLALCSLGTHEDPFPFPSYPLTDNQNQADGGNTRTYVCTQSITGASVNPAAWISGAEPSGYNVVTMAVKTASSGQTVAMGQLSETDTIPNLLPVKFAPMDQLSEADSLRTIAPEEAHIIAQVGEIDTLGTLTPVKLVTMAQLVEIDTIFTLPGVKTLQMGLLTEADTVQALSAMKAVLLAQLSEADSVQSLLGGNFELMAILTEVDSLLPLVPVKRLLLPQLGESDFIIQLGGADEITQGGTVGAPEGLKVGASSVGLTQIQIKAEGLTVDSEVESIPALGPKASSQTGFTRTTGATGLEPSYD